MANDYWRQRELDHIAKTVKDDARNARILAENQRRTMKEIQQQIDGFYGRYASTEGITMAEARKRASKLDIEEYADKAKRYVKYAHSDNDMIKAIAFTEQANEEMRLYNMTMKVNRLEILKADIDLEVIKMTSAEEHFMKEKLTANARAEYKRQAGILGDSLVFNERQARHIVSASFHNATWSERLWVNQAALRDELNTLLNRGIIQGKNPKVLARDLRKKFDASISDSERLMITEMARVQGDVFKDAMQQLDIDKYEWVAEPTACPICMALDGKVFSMEDWEDSGNIIPKHPRCRCALVGVADREGWEADLTSRGL